MDEKKLICWILRDWTSRVIRDLDHNNIAPAPYAVAQAIAQVGRVLSRWDRGEDCWERPTDVEF